MQAIPRRGTIKNHFYPNYVTDIILDRKFNKENLIKRIMKIKVILIKA